MFAGGWGCERLSLREMRKEILWDDINVPQLVDNLIYILTKKLSQLSFTV